MIRIKNVWKMPDKISFVTLLYFVILLPFIQQRSLEELPRIATIYKAATLLASACIIAYISIRKSISLRGSIVLHFLFWGIYILSSCIYSQRSIPRVLYNTIVFLSMMIFIYAFIRKDLRLIMRILSYIYGAFIYLNFILYLIFPKGLYKTTSYHAAHLLGDDNAVVFVALPGLVIMSCYSILQYSKIKWPVWTAAVLTEIFLIRVWSVSALAMLTLFLFLLIYVTKKRNINYMLLLGIVLSAMFVCLFGLSNSKVQALIVNVLHKDATLSGRTLLWAGALKMVSKSPILGYGGYYEYGRFNTSAMFTYSCHTPYLQLMIDGGLLLFGVFVLIVFIAFRQMRKKPNNVYLGIMTIGLTCMMINYITEQVRFYHLFIIVALMMNIDVFPDTTAKDLNQKNSTIRSLQRIKDIRLK